MSGPACLHLRMIYNARYPANTALIATYAHKPAQTALLQRLLGFAAKARTSTSALAASRPGGICRAQPQPSLPPLARAAVCKRGRHMRLPDNLAYTWWASQ